MHHFQQYIDLSQVPNTVCNPIRVPIGVNSTGSLEYVDLGNVQRIYDGAIENCGITHIDLPDNLNHVHKGAIRDCIDLQSIHVHNGSEKMDHGAFLGCDHLRELVFWSGGEMIGRNFDLFDGNVPRDLVIRGREGSMAQQYAQRCGIPFEIIN
jgi:hypothetical protein